MKALAAANGDDSEVKNTMLLIEAARRSLQEARTLPDIRRVMEAASVAVDAAQRAAKLAQAEAAAAEVVEAANAAANDAAVVRIEAQAQAGALLREMRECGERDAGHGDRRAESHAAIPKLADLGVTNSESSRWQRVANVPVEVRANYVEKTRAAKTEVSTAGLLKYASVFASPASDGSSSSKRYRVDHAAIAAEARKQIRKVYRDVLTLPGYRPDALVVALSNSERRYLLRALHQLDGWMDKVRAELAAFRVTEERQ